MNRISAYERDPYLKQLEVEVVGVGETAGRPYAVLDDTLLYPEGGGQPPDQGDLAGVAVIDVQTVEGEIRHYLESPCGRGRALLVLDWQRRYDHMQQHTAQHLLSALALTRCGWATRSFHLGPETADIELDAPELSDDDLAALEDAAMTEIVEGHTVATRRVSPAAYKELDVRSRGLPAGHTGDIRLVEIEGIDLNTCGGTHLKSTREIQVIKILRTERLRGGTRVQWVAGTRVRRRLAAHEARNDELRALLDSDDTSLTEVASLKLDQLAAARRRARYLEAQLAGAMVESLAASEDPILSAHFEDTDGGFLQQIARGLLERVPAKAALLTASGKKGSFFLVAAGHESGFDAGRLGPRVAEILDGRGGGSGVIFQGKAGSLEKRGEAESIFQRKVAESEP